MKRIVITHVIEVEDRVTIGDIRRFFQEALDHAPDTVIGGEVCPMKLLFTEVEQA